MRRVAIDAGSWLGNISAAQALLAPSFAGRLVETCFVLLLDQEHCLIAQLVVDAIEPGTVDLPFRKIVTEALASDTRAMILAHNHPDGDPTPSMADKLATRRLAEVAAPLGLRLLDHLIFADDTFISFRALGLL